jgi:hypothetical protein
MTSQNFSPATSDGTGADRPRRSRGGRGRGGRAEGASTEGDVSAVDRAPADDQVPFPDTPPEIAEQPPTHLEDQPVVPAAEVVLPDVSPEPGPAAEAGPKRRRRATSRPAGPPTVSV